MSSASNNASVRAVKLRTCLAAVAAFACLARPAPPPARAGDISVRTNAQFRAALGRLAPGTTVVIAPGTYRGGVYLRNVAGTAEAPVVIRGRDPKNPPVFAGGGSEGLHLMDCRYVTLANLKVRGFSGNGINIDDAGTFKTPSHHIVVQDVTIERTGPKGNNDALKMSGVDYFTVRRCRFDGWGGSAIDMVGCHNGVVEDCHFVGRADSSQHSGIQLKGGTRNVLVQTSFFHNAGDRPINLGGSTGLKFFRPKVNDFEAKEITIAGNRFSGGEAPVAWATANGGHVHHNTIHMPGKWVMRILQETGSKRFKPCGGGRFEDNLVVYDKRVGVFVNVGPATAPGTFIFRRNAWFGPGRQIPRLPTRETGGVYQVDPKLKDPGTAKMTVTSKDPRLKGIGADGYVPPKQRPDQPAARQ